MKRSVRGLLVGVALVSASTAALAFQESKGGAGGPAQQGQGKAPLDLRGTGTSVDTTGSASSGIEVRIPGLGKLGVLPKFDFGLELLYGVNDAKGPESPDRLRTPEDEDTRIRGTLKHRF